MKILLQTTILFYSNLFCLLCCSGHILQEKNPSLKQNLDDSVEKAANILIDLDQFIESSFNADATVNQLYSSQNEQSDIQSLREEKFSAVLQDLNKIETQIKEAIARANSNRQMRLVMRLRPLLSYVNHINRNMELLRARVVAVATLSNLSVTVNEVLDQFGDVMTSSMGMGASSPSTTGHHLPTPASSVPTQTSTSPKVTRSPTRPLQTDRVEMKSNPGVATTTMTYNEVESAENFFKNIISQRD